MKSFTRFLFVLNLTALYAACGGGITTNSAQGLDTEASLSSLSISTGTLDPAFNLSVNNYTATVPNGTDSVDVSATTSDNNDSFTINGSDNATVALVVGDNTISIVVTAEDGTSSRTYTIVITRLTFAQQAYVDAANAETNHLFGLTTALSGDGNTLAFGAIDEDAVYVFARDSGGIWTQQAYVKASNTDANDLFGLSAALSGDGNTLAVGAVDEDSAATGVNGDQADNTQRNAGAVYVFTRDSGSVWTQQAYVKASNTSFGDVFGWNVILSSDGDALAVDAFDEDRAAISVNGDQADNTQRGAGSVYVFTRDNGGVWTQQAYVKASNTDANDLFGLSAALSDDGNTLADGAFDEDSGTTSLSPPDY